MAGHGVTQHCRVWLAWLRGRPNAIDELDREVGEREAVSTQRKAAPIAARLVVANPLGMRGRDQCDWMIGASAGLTGGDAASPSATRLPARYVVPLQMRILRTLRHG